MIKDPMDIFSENEVVIDRIAETQGDVYQLAYDIGFDMKDFSDKYLSSDFCRNEMDTVYSRFQLELDNCCMDEVLIELESKGIELRKTDKKILSYSHLRVR